MKRLTPLFILAALAVALVPSFAAAAPLDQNAFCGPGQKPFFQFGFADLAAHTDIGQPTECEHPNASNGDTLQHTTKGLAFYRASTNTPTFTDGWNHYGLTSIGPVTWVGNSIDPPASALNNHAGDLAYLNSVVPVATRSQEVQNKIRDVFANFGSGNYNSSTTLLLLGAGLSEWQGVVNDFNSIQATPKYAHVHSTYQQANDLWTASIRSFMSGLQTNNVSYIRQANNQLDQANALYDSATGELNSIQPG